MTILLVVVGEKLMKKSAKILTWETMGHLKERWHREEIILPPCVSGNGTDTSLLASNNMFGLLNKGHYHIYETAKLCPLSDKKVGNNDKWQLCS